MLTQGEDVEVHALQERGAIENLLVSVGHGQVLREGSC